MPERHHALALPSDATQVTADLPLIITPKQAALERFLTMKPDDKPVILDPFSEFQTGLARGKTAQEVVLSYTEGKKYSPENPLRIMHVGLGKEDFEV